MSRPRYVPLFASVAHSEKLADLPDDACRLFYLLLLPQCDEWGRCSARPRVLGATVWPMLGKSAEDTARAVRELQRVGLIEIHRGPDGDFVVVPDWEDKAGQVGKRDHRRVSEWPDPTDASLVGPDADASGQSGPVRANSGQAGPSLAGACAETRARRRASGARAGAGAQEGEREREGTVADLLAEPEFAALAADPAFPGFWRDVWLPHRRETGKPYKPRGARECLRKALKAGPAPWIEAAREAMSNGWQGVFPAGTSPPATNGVTAYMHDLERVAKGMVAQRV